MKVFNKATLGGLIALLNNPSEETICGSTEGNSCYTTTRNTEAYKLEKENCAEFYSTN